MTKLVRLNLLWSRCPQELDTISAGKEALNRFLGVMFPLPINETKRIGAYDSEITYKLGEARTGIGSEA
jgi:hypothetical protein